MHAHIFPHSFTQGKIKSIIHLLACFWRYEGTEELGEKFISTLEEHAKLHTVPRAHD